MTKKEMLSYINNKIATCENMVYYAKSNKVDICILNANNQMLDFYKSVLPIVEKVEEE